MRNHKEVTGKQIKYRGKWFEINQTDGVLYKVFDNGKGVCYEKEFYEIKRIKDTIDLKGVEYCKKCNVIVISDKDMKKITELNVKQEENSNGKSKAKQ